MNEFFQKYERLFILILGFMLGVIFLSIYGGEYQRGRLDEKQKSADQWNDLVNANMKGRVK